MKFYISIAAIILISFNNATAQQFVNKATVEYEVKTNIKKTMGNNSWDEMMKENLSQFKTSFYTLSFVNNKSVYKFDHWDPSTKVPEWIKKNDEENTWFVDHDKNSMSVKKTIVGSNFIVNDSIPTIEWQLSNESRVIAGYNCRKATGKLFDSVYVFAFYSDEITISGGPCTLNGLPGLILGLTIPRMYTSWIATKVTIDAADEKAIIPFTSKKTYTTKTLQGFIKENTKDWFNEDDADSKKEIQQFLWSSAL